MRGASVSSTGLTRSASADSGTPVVRTLRERTTRRRFVLRRASRGRTSSSRSPRISRGTPGSSTATLPRGSSSHSPGAVPRGFGSTVAPSGTSAWRRFAGGIGQRPIRRKRASRASSRPVSSTKGRPNSCATTVLVMSSRVGPKPPVVMTKPVRSRASPTAARMSSGRSATLVRRTTSTPAAASAWPSSAPLESSV